jgi:hypothetical protein
LTTLPRVALTLAQPQLVRSFVENGLIAASYRAGGQLFLEHVATYTSRALAGPVLARSQKGDASSARVLLRSAVRSNAALFGLDPDGARLAAEALDALRDKPGPLALQGTLILLEKIRHKYSLAKKPGTVEPLKDLALALAGRAPPSLPQPGESGGSRPPVMLTQLEVTLDQASHLKQKPPSREVPEHEPEPPPRNAPKSRK